MSNFTHELILIDEADVSGFRSNQANPLRVHVPDILIGSGSWPSCSSAVSAKSSSRLIVLARTAATPL
jgi:hypothetical protein